MVAVGAKGVDVFETITGNAGTNVDVFVGIGVAAATVFVIVT